jgi:CRP/FNR family transcriptional regulator, cyclic AMP receptor protein
MPITSISFRLDESRWRRSRRAPASSRFKQSGEALGWSWLFPPHRWHFGARSIDATDVVVFDARTLREKSEENHDFGYEIAMRVGQVILQRLQATRMQLLDFYAAPA